MSELGRVSDGQREIQRLTDAGFSGPEIQQYQAEQTERLKAGGFQPQEIDQYWGAPKPEANEGLRRIYDHQLEVPNPPPGASEEAFRAGFGHSYDNGGIDGTPFITAASTLMGPLGGGTWVKSADGRSQRFEPNGDTKHMAATLLDIYQQTGVPPQVLMQKAQADPTVMQQILAHDREGRVSETLADTAAPITAGSLWERTKHDFMQSFEGLQTAARDPVAAAMPAAAGANAAMGVLGMLFSPAVAAGTELVGKPFEQWQKDHPMEARALEAGPLAPMFTIGRAQQTLDSLSRGEVPDLTAPIPMEATGEALTMAIPIPHIPRIGRAARERAAARAAEEPREEVPPTPDAGAAEARAPEATPSLRGAVDDAPLWVDREHRPGRRAGDALQEERERETQEIHTDAMLRASVGRAPSPHGDLGLNQISGLERSKAAAARLGVSESQVVSPAGAIGRYQIMPATGRAYGYTREQLFDPVINEKVAKALLGDLRRRFPGDPEAQAIAYNAGPTRAYKWIAAGRNDKVLPHETQGYIGRLREWGDIPGRRPDDIAADNYRLTDQRLTGDSNWSPPDGPVPPKREGGGAGGEPPRGPDDVSGPEGGPKRERLTGDTVFKLNEDMLDSLIADQYAPEVAKDRWYQRMNPMKIVAMFQSELSHIKLTEAAPDQLDVKDMLRQRYASTERVGLFVDRGRVDAMTLDVDPNSPSYKDAYRAVLEDGGHAQGFRAYRNAARTVELAKRDIESGIDIEVAKRKIQLGHEKYQRGAKTLGVVKDGVVDFVRDSGRYSEKGAEVMKRLNRYHISMRRAVDPEYIPAGSRPRGRFGSTKKIEGSDRLFMDQDIADFDNMSHQIAMADHNRAVVSFVEAWKRGEVAEVELTIDKGATERLQIAGRKTLKGEVLDEMGNPIPDPEVAQAFHQETELTRAEHELGANKFVIYREGRPEVWSFKGDPYVFRLLTYPGLSKDNLPMKIATGVAKFMRSGVASTATFIERVFVRNELEDFVVGKNVRAPFEDFFRGLPEVMWPRKLYDSIQAKGGLNATLADIDRHYLRNMQAEVFTKQGVWSRVWNTVNPYNWPEAVRTMQRAHGNARNIGMFKRLTKQGTPDIKAAMLSREGYMDLAEPLTENWVNGWSRMTVFMRTSVKSIERMHEAATTRPATFLLKGFLGITSFTIANRVLNMIADESLPENEKYANVPQWQKDLFWVLPPIKVGDTYVRIPIPRPYTVGFVFGTIPERMMDAFVEHDPRAFREFGKTFMQQFMFPIMPAIAAPAIEDISNTAFTGAPLVPRSMADASGYMQYKPDTSETAKALSRLLSSEVGVLAHLNIGLNVSPIVLDNYVKGWTGSLPMQALKVLESPWHYEGRPWEAANIPLVGVFIMRNPGAGAQPIQDFYSEYDRVVGAHRDLSLAIERQDMSEIQDAATLKAFLSISGVAKTMREQAGILHAINTNEDLTDAEKQKLLDGLYMGMVITAKGGLAAIDALDQADGED